MNRLPTPTQKGFRLPMAPPNLPQSNQMMERQYNNRYRQRMQPTTSNTVFHQTNQAPPSYNQSQKQHVVNQQPNRVSHQQNQNKQQNLPIGNQQQLTVVSQQHVFTAPYSYQQWLPNASNQPGNVAYQPLPSQHQQIVSQQPTSVYTPQISSLQQENRGAHAQPLQQFAGHHVATSHQQTGQSHHYANQQPLATGIQSFQFHGPPPPVQESMIPPDFLQCPSNQVLVNQNHNVAPTSYHTQVINAHNSGDRLVYGQVQTPQQLAVQDRKLVAERLAAKNQKEWDKAETIRLAAQEKERLAVQQEKERLAAQQKDRLASQQKERLAAQQTERLAAQQNKLLAAQEKERLAAQQRERLAAQQNKLLAAQEKERLAAQQRERQAAQQNKLLAALEKERLAAQQRERLAAQQEKERLASQRENLSAEQRHADELGLINYKKSQNVEILMPMICCLQNNVLVEERANQALDILSKSFQVPAYSIMTVIFVFYC